jgi:hypothetical protein
LGTDKETSMETNGRQEESLAIEQPRRVTKSILCPEAPRKKNSNREGQKEMKRGDCNKAPTEGTQMRDSVMFMAPST